MTEQFLNRSEDLRTLNLGQSSRGKVSGIDCIDDGFSLFVMLVSFWPVREGDIRIEDGCGDQSAS